MMLVLTMICQKETSLCRAVVLSGGQLDKIETMIRRQEVEVL